MRTNAKRFKKIYGITAILLILFLSFVLILKLLSDGFRIENISIANVKISGLYLKLDKKLILEIKHIDLKHIKQNKNVESTPPKLKDITQIIRYAVSLSSFFQKLELKQIDFDEEKYFVHFDGNSFKVNIPYILADFKIENEENDIVLNIQTLKVKQEDLIIKGKIAYYEKGNVFTFDLESYINNKQDNVISYQGETNLKYLSVVLDSTQLDSIDILAPYIKMLDDDVYEWMFERAKFDSIAINRAQLYTRHLNTKNFDKIINDNLYASGTLQNVRLKFDDNLGEISAPSVDVVFEGGKLIFSTQDVMYNENLPTPTKVSRANVELSDFLAPQTLLSIDINVGETLLDNNILEILNNYDITLPLLQKHGINSGSLKLDILLPTGKLETKASAMGDITIHYSTLDIMGLDLEIDSAHIALNGDLIDINKANVKFKDIMQSEVNIKIDTDKKNITLNATPSVFNIKSGESEIINLNEIPLTASMDFSSDFSAKIAPLDVFINAKNDDIFLSAKIEKLLPFTPMLSMLDIKNGNIFIKIPQNKDNLSLKATLNNLNYPIYYLNKNRVTSLQIDGIIKNDEIILKDDSNKISLTITPESSEIDLNIGDKFVDINEILDSKIPLFADMFSQNQSTGQSNTNFLIEGKNVTLGLFGYNIPFEEAMLKTTQSGFIANAKNKNGIANIILDSETIHIEANNFNADFVNGVFEKDIVEGGTFGVFGIYRKNRFVGDVGILDTSVKEMATLQNILSFIDAIPSLVVFKLPGFSASGYEIDKANIRIGLDSNYLALENIDINGSSVDISGNGVVDLNTHDVNVRLELSTIKSLSTILNKIPIIGFLLLGEDGKITTDLTITGTIESPKTEISLLEDAAKTPLNILKRVFSPFQVLIDELKKENQKRRGAR